MVCVKPLQLLTFVCCELAGVCKSKKNDYFVFISEMEALQSEYLRSYTDPFPIILSLNVKFSCLYQSVFAVCYVLSNLLTKQEFNNITALFSCKLFIRQKPHITNQPSTEIALVFMPSAAVFIHSNAHNAHMSFYLVIQREISVGGYRLQNT